jgi:TonB family protein
VEVLTRNKRYPEDAIRRRVEGQVLVGFTLTRDGYLVASKIIVSSGSASLDAEALDLLKRTEPFAPIPPNYPRSQIALTLPLRFHLGDAASSTAVQNPKPSDAVESDKATAVQNPKPSGADESDKATAVQNAARQKNDIRGFFPGMTVDLFDSNLDKLSHGQCRRVKLV